MKKTHFIITALVLAGSIFTGCKNKKTETIDPTTNSSIEEFIAKNGAKKQNFKINIDQEAATITGDEGSTVTFPKDAFMTASGQAVSGDVSIQLIEILDQAGMVLSDRPTTSNGQLLVSGGEIYIGATINGEQLVLNDNTSIRITLPTDQVDPGMTLFTGNADTSGQFNWTEIPNVDTMVTQGGGIADTSWMNDTEPRFYYDPSQYIFTISNIGWINCDRFYDAPIRTDINIVCNGDFDAGNIRAFLVFKDINSVTSAWSNNNDNILLGSNIPVGQQVSIVVFCLKDDKEYIAIKEVTVSANLQVTIDLEETTAGGIKSLIDSKFN